MIATNRIQIVAGREAYRIQTQVYRIQWVNMRGERLFLLCTLRMRHILSTRWRGTAFALMRVNN